MTDIVLGTMTWGRETNYSGAKKCYDLARKHGVDFFDTAAIYGDGLAETWLGEFIRGDASVKVSTKVGYGGGWPFEEAEWCIKRLGGPVEIIYHHHWAKWGCDDKLWSLGDCVGKLAKRIGLSNCAAWQAVQADNEVGVHAVQFLYNLLKRQAEVELIPAANHFGWEKFAYSPLASGLLTGKYSHDRDPCWRLCSDARYRRRYTTSGDVFEPDHLMWLPHGMWRGGKDAPPPALAIAWVLHKGCRPIVGARTEDQLRELLRPFPESMRYFLDGMDEMFPSPPPATDRSEECHERESSLTPCRSWTYGATKS